MSKKKIFPDFSVDGQIVLITGAAGHLGKPIVKAFAAGGATVIAVSRDQAKLADLQSEMNEDGFMIKIANFDITNEEEVKKFFATIDIPHLNVIINNAYAGKSGGMNSTKEDFDNAFDVAVSSPFILIKYALPFLKKAVAKNESTSVINVASMYGIVSPKFEFYENESGYNPPFYGAAKAGLLQLTKYLGCLLAKEGIRVNAISPGPFPSEEAQKNERLMKGIIQKSPMGRIGKAHELTGAMIFLASKSSSYITGINISIDGGWTAST